MSNIVHKKCLDPTPTKNIIKVEPYKNLDNLHLITSFWYWVSHNPNSSWDDMLYWSDTYTMILLGLLEFKRNRNPSLSKEEEGILILFLYFHCSHGTQYNEFQNILAYKGLNRKMWSRTILYV